MPESGYSLRDILHIIAHGTLTGSEFNQALANWKYTFKGEDLDGSDWPSALSMVRRHHHPFVTASPAEAYQIRRRHNGTYIPQA